MLIAQISDCHLFGTNNPRYGGIDTRSALSNAMAVIRSLPVQPDVVLATGDLADGGLAEEYCLFRNVLAPLGVPVIPVMGNHDDPDALAGVFGLRSEYSLQESFVQFAVETYAIRLLVIDSTTRKSGQPSLCDARLRWIASKLSESKRPTLIAMHHPPFPAGVAWMEPDDRDWADPLAELVKKHGAVVRVVSGHVHRSASAIWAGTLAMSAPSTAHQVYLDLAPKPAPQFSREAPGFLLHQWTGSRLTSYGVAVPGFGETFVPETSHGPDCA